MRNRWAFVVIRIGLRIRESALSQDAFEAPFLLFRLVLRVIYCSGRTNQDWYFLSPSKHVVVLYRVGPNQNQTIYSKARLNHWFGDPVGRGIQYDVLCNPDSHGNVVSK